MQNLTAIYLRLSRDDENASESESITNQKMFLLGYAKENSMNIVDIFADDGYSGTTYDRPEFKRMLEMIEQKKINTVITKDLSRLGRDYIQTGYYLEQYFPLHRVRYIAVNDGIDTYAAGGGNDMSPFRAVFNDMYARDISKKVRTALNTKKLNGQFIGSAAPYGYMKDPADKNHLVIDENAAVYVRRIYSLFLSGESISGIARRLSQQKVPTPSEYRGLKNAGSAWSDSVIRRILTNPTYAGNLTQNTSKKINYKLNRKISIPRREWITVNGTHEPIITQDDFDAASRLLSRRSYSKRARTGMTHLLTGLVFCKDCGSVMSFIRESPSRTYLVCSRWRRGAACGICTSHSIREDRVENALREKLKELACTVDTNRILSRADDFFAAQSCKKQLLSVNRQISVCKAAALSLYKDKAAGIISESEYLEMSAAVRAQRAEQEKILSELTYEEDGRPDSGAAAAALRSVLDFDSADRNTLALLVDKIYIGTDKKIEIIFRFRCPSA